MKVPVEWLEDYLPFKKTPKELAQAFTMVGLLLDKPLIQFEQAEYKTVVLDLEHRMDRSDWLSILGCARDIAAYFDSEVVYPEKMDQELPQVSATDKITIQVDCPDLVRRFNTLVVKNAKVAESPAWLKNRLEAYGIPSINNVVDITNYVMVEYGQPMHAQDISKMRAKEIVIRRATNGEELVTFLGEKMVLDDSMFVLTQAGKATVIGGIVGGEETGVDVNTTSFVLDAGNYDQVNIRRTSRKLKIQNETVLRYDKVLHPALTQVALHRAALLIKELTGGEVFANEDYHAPDVKLDTKVMTLTQSRLNLIYGQDFELAKAETILKNLEYSVLAQTPTTLQLQVPYFRTDVDVQDDIVADVLRIYGYNNIEPDSLTGKITAEITPPSMKLEERIRDSAAIAGLNEYITSPFVDFDNSHGQIQLINTVNQGMNALRTTIKQTLKTNLRTYLLNNMPICGIFELGTVFYKDDQGKLCETRHVQVISYPEENAIKTAQKTKNLLTTLMKELGYKYFIHKEKTVYSIFSATKPDLKLGELSHDSFYLDVSRLIALSSDNLSVKEKLQNLQKRDVTLSGNSEHIGEALYYIQNNYPDLQKIEVKSIYLNEAEKTKTIGVSLYFAETVLDAEKAKNDILLVLKEQFGVELK